MVRLTDFNTVFNDPFAQGSYKNSQKSVLDINYLRKSLTVILKNSVIHFIPYSSKRG